MSPLVAPARRNRGVRWFAPAHPHAPDLVVLRGLDPPSWRPMRTPRWSVINGPAARRPPPVARRRYHRQSGVSVGDWPSAAVVCDLSGIRDGTACTIPRRPLSKPSAPVKPSWPQMLRRCSRAMSGRLPGTVDRKGGDRYRQRSLSHRVIHMERNREERNQGVRELNRIVQVRVVRAPALWGPASQVRSGRMSCTP